jgi:hypothetical protein
VFLVLGKEPIIETKPLARKLDAFISLSEAELGFLDRLHDRRRTFVAGRDLVHQGRMDQAAHILVSGWACCTKFYMTANDKSLIFKLSATFGNYVV